MQKASQNRFRLELAETKKRNSKKININMLYKSRDVEIIVPLKYLCKF